ncbi:MAG: DUF4339 domain-containing protein [Methylotenera sp.]|nr:DUF4339 domain-containing protein [Oligoflexia bacterium]
MENTVKVLFEGDNTPQWYIAQGDRWIGPLTASDIYEKVIAQEITWAHFVWKPGQAEWQRICDIQTFQAAVPTLPAKSVVGDIEKTQPGITNTRVSAAGSAASAAAASFTAASTSASASPNSASASSTSIPVATSRPEKEWFLHYNDSQFGPFASEEVSRFISIGKIHGRVYSWRNGMSDWQKLETIPEFVKVIQAAAATSMAVPPRKGPPAAPAAAKASVVEASQIAAKEAAKVAAEEKRGTPRRPLIAKIFVANEQSLHVGVCRDVSIGGMQVLTDQIPGVAGDKIKMNVSPAGDSKSDQVDPFVAEGVIVRILEDGLGFSFRFNRLDDNAKRSIEKHLGTREGVSS